MPTTHNLYVTLQVLFSATVQESGHNVSQTDASVVVVVSGNTHNVWRIMYSQYNRLCLQHVCRSHNAFRIIHPIGIYTHNARAPGRSSIHPQCNRLCLERLYRSCAVACLLFFIHKKIMVENVIYITSEYEERLRRCQYVPKLSFGRRMLKDDGAPNRFFLLYLFCNEFCT